MPWGPFLTWTAQILIIVMVAAIIIGLIYDWWKGEKKKED